MTGSALYSVLMVDDNAAMREALARSLTRRGCRVTTAAGDVEALQVLKERSFDAVITDLNMPERGGLWLWRQALMLRPELRGRFILIASEPLPEPRSLSLFMETERFVLKPLSLDTLWREVEDILKGVPRAPSGSPAEPPGRAARGAP
ncbi:MAG: hypothetical protein DMD60_14055 [Gemmatimonadetes bacterium]|nr:MAG: hypothetical protein DMD60_14055 [Gemmatimonadota bacterium]